MTGYMCVIGERGKWKGAGSAPLTVPQNQKLGIKAQPYWVLRQLGFNNKLQNFQTPGFK